MKKIAITLLLISLTGMALFAEGSQEDTTWDPGMGRGYTDQNFQRSGSMPSRVVNNRSNNGSWGPLEMRYPNQNISEESLILTGKIDLTDVNLPKLTVGEKTYELMVPYRLDYDIDIKDGDEITINGFEVPAYRRDADTELTNLMVTGATYDGTDYDLKMMDNGTMGYGRQADKMNNYGPSNGRRGKHGRVNNNSFQNNSRNWGPQQNNMPHRPYGRR
ncbi:MAG: hypothetical protein DRH89_09585 [Candidatus Cloacimonadota bacterium]|nr:MAG: hypothetical protein DRH89_09585 [Candidatus Cloacimonadota bacterium]